MNPAVTEYIQSLDKPWQAEVCGTIRQIVQQSVPEVEERIQYRKPHFLKNVKYAGALGTAKEWVSFTIFNAESLDAPEGFFEDGPPERKTIKIREGQDVDYALLAQFVEQAASTV